MKIICDKSGTGKTEKLLKEISETYQKATVVCENPKHMIEKAYNMGINNITFITIDDILEDFNSNYDNVFFDDIQYFFSGLFGPGVVKGFTATTEN